MYTPHPHFQQACQRCGRLPAHPMATCSSCGMLLDLPWTSQRYGPPPMVPGSPTVSAPQPSFSPLIVELVLNFIGIYGVGWLLLGKKSTGLILLGTSLVLWFFVAVLAILTLGLGIICLGPLAIVAILCNIFLLQQAMKRNVY